jgi:ParB family chromosome partitioning protein
MYNDPSNAVLKQLPIELITKGSYQPRINFDAEALSALADSIKEQGIIQPIVVRAIQDKTHRTGYELIAGERRWRAAQLAGLHEIPAIIRQVSDQSMALMSLIENIQREDLRPLEQAQALRCLIDEFNLSHQQAAEKIGRSRSAVSNLLRLLDLGKTATDLLNNAQLEMGHARALLSLAPKQQAQVAKQVAKQAWSVRKTESFVKNLLTAPTSPKQQKIVQISSEIQQLEQDLSEKLGAKVSLNYQKSGKGKLSIEYHSLDELEGILAHIH